MPGLQQIMPPSAPSFCSALQPPARSRPLTGRQWAQGKKPIARGHCYVIEMQTAVHLQGNALGLTPGQNLRPFAISYLFPCHFKYTKKFRFSPNFSLSSALAGFFARLLAFWPRLGPQRAICSIQSLIAAGVRLGIANSAINLGFGSRKIIETNWQWFAAAKPARGADSKGELLYKLGSSLKDIIKQRTSLMFYYPLTSQFQMQQLAWFLLPPAQALPCSEAETPHDSPSSGSSLTGSWSQQTKEGCFPLAASIEIGRRESLVEAGSQEGCKIKNKVQNHKKSKCYQLEEEFRPNAPEVRRGRKTPQNANRNVVPNIMHQVISFMQKKCKSEKLVQRLIEKLGAGDLCSSRRFYYYQLLIKQKMNHYVNAESLRVLGELQEPLCEVYPQQEQRHYNTISRLLVQYFLSREFDAIILTSRRVSAAKRHDHLKTRRRILEQFGQMFPS